MRDIPLRPLVHRQKIQDYIKMAVTFDDMRYRFKQPTYVYISLHIFIYFAYNFCIIQT